MKLVVSPRAKLLTLVLRVTRRSFTL